jgi:hypothetical protein
MIDIYLHKGSFRRLQHGDFVYALSGLEEGRRVLRETPLQAIIELLHTCGRSIMRKPELAALPGAGYIALWSSRENLSRMVELNYGALQFHEHAKVPTGYEVCLEPRGIVAHFVAGNIPHLTFFSLVLALLSKNGSIVKVPEEHVSYLLELLRVLSATDVKLDRKKYRGRDLIKSIALVGFRSADIETAKAFSLLADARIVWGGHEAVESINGLPQKAHADTIVFGPKYSFGVFDKKCVKGRDFKKVLSRAAQDIVLFDQMACSSPHVYFFEKSGTSLSDIADMLRERLEALPSTLRRKQTSPEMASRIINERGRYYLDPSLDIVAPESLEWTILMNKSVALEEPLQGGCIYLKEIDSLDDVLPLVTRKVQAISIGIDDRAKSERFAEGAAYRGVDRVVRHGSIHDFTLPWDGMLPLSRLVRFALFKR